MGVLQRRSLKNSSAKCRVGSPSQRERIIAIKTFRTAHLAPRKRREYSECSEEGKSDTEEIERMLKDVGQELLLMKLV